MPGRDGDVLQLAELFPALSLASIEAAVRNAASLDMAAEALLRQVRPAAAARCRCRSPPPPPSPPL